VSETPPTPQHEYVRPEDRPEPTRSDADIADTLFGSTEALVSTFGPPIKSDLDRLGDHLGLTPAQKTAHLEEAAHTFFDARLNSDQGARIHSLIVEHTINPPDDETVQKWTVEARRQLRVQYGDSADRRMAAAKEFINNRPELKQRLVDTGLASHPTIVMALAEKADVLRPKPRKR
jgi:glucose-6-phosphate dehydrogenase assembly protein OpcA